MSPDAACIDSLPAGAPAGTSPPVAGLPAGTPQAGAELLPGLVAHLRHDRLDEAEAVYRELCSLDEDWNGVLLFPVLIAIQRGQVADALHLVNRYPPDHSPELRALCLHLMGDPTWHGEAQALIDSPDPVKARAMRQLLGMPDPMD